MLVCFHFSKERNKKKHWASISEGYRRSSVITIVHIRFITDFNAPVYTQTLSMLEYHKARATLFILSSFSSRPAALPRKTNFNIHASRVAFGFVFTSKGNTLAGAPHRCWKSDEQRQGIWTVNSRFL